MSAGPLRAGDSPGAFPRRTAASTAGLSEEELCERYLDEVRAAIAGFAADGVPLAGMLFCSIFANEGLPDVPGAYMAARGALVRDAGGVVHLR